MQNENTKSATCVACSCPCEIHKEHNHQVEGENKIEAKACQTCGPEHDTARTCDSGCK